MGVRDESRLFSVSSQIEFAFLAHLLRFFFFPSTPTSEERRTSPLLSPIPPYRLFFSPSLSPTISKPSFSKLLKKEAKMDSRPKVDVDAWAVSSSTRYEDDDTTRTKGRHEDDDDEDQEAAGSNEMDWTRLGEVLKRGRVKERIHELNKINSLASKGGQYSTQ